MTEVTQRPDPTARTLETLHREVTTLQDRSEALIGSELKIVNEQIVSIRREITIREDHRLELKAGIDAHRLELKAGDEKALSTAMIAAEKAVQAALAAAEKARDQQTIASQLATTKAENAFTEQLRQQKETFTIAIDAVTTGFNDMKGMIGELRAEKRGGREQITEHRAGNTQMIAVAAIVATLFGSGIVTILIKLFGA